MNFSMGASLLSPPGKVWLVLVDIERIASCIPGCEQVVEHEPLKRYSAVLKQKIGPFKLEVPAEITVDEHVEPELVRARASGRDRISGTTLTVQFRLRLFPDGAGGSRLDVEADLQVAGRLASLGYALIKKKAEENFVQFDGKLRAELENI